MPQSTMLQKRIVMLMAKYFQCRTQPNFGFNCDKYPANYCIIFYGSEVVSVFNFVVGTCALSG